MRKIYVDMDGVVADFDSWVCTLLNRKVDANDYHRITSDEWDMLGKHQRMYLELPLMESGTSIVGYCTSLVSKFNTEFLTALPSRQHMPFAMQDKIEWCKKYFPGYRVNFGPKSTDKWKWCRESYLDILIDDRKSNIEDWVSKGKGVGILHRGDLNETLTNIDAGLRSPVPVFL